MSDFIRFEAEPHLKTLRPFQRATVDHVSDVLYGKRTGTRFLVADETGLGKTMVARGVIARAIEALQDNPDVRRIDVIYICSNTDVARQNIQRLDILGSKISMSTRLSLLATSTDQLKTGSGFAGKPVNLVSLTPKTSFPDKGWRSGTARERALLFVILCDYLQLSGAAKTAAYRVLQGTVQSLDRFKQRVAGFEEGIGASPGHAVKRLDQQIVAKFLELAEERTSDDGSALQRFRDLVEQTTGRPAVPGGYSAASAVISELRKVLSRAGVEALEPDLVILDEFQRFTELLETDSPVSELAQELFNYRHAKVLLLSATPYKPIDDGPEGDGTHQSQFLGVLDFLARGAKGEGAQGIAKLLDEYRQAVKNRQDPGVLRDRIRAELLTVMCRTERPPRQNESMVEERRTSAPSISSEAVTQYKKFSELADLVGARFPMDVWKSVPELVHFFESYQLGRFVGEAIEDEDVRALVASLDRLDPAAVENFDPLTVRNPRLEALIGQTTGRNWQTMLWLPPSLPYLKPGGPFAAPEAARMTKKLVFSQWTATPTAVASLLSHDANRRIARSGVATGRDVTASRHIPPRLRFSRRGEQLTAMASFIPFFPMPGLADMADPLRRAGAAGRPFDREYAESRIAGELSGKLPQGARESGAGEVASLVWQWPLALSDEKLDEALSGIVANLTPADAIAGRGAQEGIESDDDRADQSTVIDEYVSAAIEVHRQRETLDLSVIPPELTTQTARLAMHSPANCAWRAFGRLSVNTSQVTTGGRWRAAAILASGLRTLFNRWESALVLDHLYEVELSYWQKVLRYCADGNLQAVLDEHLFHLVQVEGNSEFDDEALVAFAWRAADALKLKPAIYKAKDPLQQGNDIDFSSRFALRYGDARQNEESARPGEIREAFNSPFWPFVLVSTSVGQEGIDFHPWCHNLVHWNVPGSPVDFEQRDGRVNRFRGHAVRRNIADKHGSKMLAADNPWQEAYRLAAQDAPNAEIAGLAPDWIYPGQHKVIRDVLPYQLSVDAERLKRTHERVALYRLTFGQPRQEDLLELLRSSGVTAEQADSWRIDLRP
ncbi:helicase [Rhodococcus sp. PAMC28707]|uniref:helicase-related protein n=1 Tax=unclassified Rhodococcus (in: high G+C Gram-positive bacteria) TaxID=192944 RepID=UPI00109E0634|nr:MULTISPECIES: helicase-related protein [unclassified Rhodococcus (in: high G+C Gram-positive bacteria)]QCB51993.1 helicase [Rhodococcus sp. PAMC28705]QCB59838.1 helicase [Rhodococcus sp. PAMC28707]